MKVSGACAGYLVLFILLFDSLRPWYEPSLLFGTAIRELIGLQEANWQWRNDKNPLPSHVAAMAALDSHHFASGGESSIYYSQNAGFDWHKASLVLSSGKPLIKDFSVKQLLVAEDNSIFALVHLYFQDSSGSYARSHIFRSVDKGRKYHEFSVLPGLFSDVALYRNSKRKENRLVAVGRAGEIIAIMADGSHDQLRLPGGDSLLSVTVTGSGTIIAVGKRALMVRISREESVDERRIFSAQKYKKKENSLDKKKRRLTFYDVVAIGRQRVILAGEEGLFLSEDDGISFIRKKISGSPVFHSLIEIAHNRAIALDKKGSMYRSLNGGANWELIYRGEMPGPGLLVRLPGNVLYRVNPFLTGKSALYRSTDGANSFYPMLLGEIAPGFALALEGDGAAFIANKSDDGAGVLFHLKNFLNAPVIVYSSLRSFSSLVRVSSRTTMIGEGKNGIRVSGENEKDYFFIRPRFLPFVGREALADQSKGAELGAMASIQKGVVFGLGKEIILRSADGGKNFQFVFYMPGIRFYKLLEKSSGEIFVLGRTNKRAVSYLFRSVDEGLSFQLVGKIDRYRLFDLAFLEDKDILAVGTGPGGKGALLQLALKKGRLFSTRALNLLPDISWGSVSSVNDHTIFLISGLDVKKEVSSIFKLTFKKGEVDVKKLWSDPEKTGQRIISLTRVSGRKWLAVGEQGVYSSIDNALSWHKVLISRHVDSVGWIFWIVLVILGLWSLGAWHFMHEKPKSKEIDLLQSDQPVREAHDDQYGVLPLVESLVTLITSRATTPPMSIGISGPWGCGKSSLMGMTKDMAGRCNVKTVWFNVWYHQNEKHMLASLMRSFQRHVIPPFFTLEHLIFRMHLFYERTLKSHSGFASFLTVTLVSAFLTVFCFEFVEVWLLSYQWDADGFPRLGEFLQGGVFRAILITFWALYVFLYQTRNFKEVGRLFSSVTDSLGAIFGVQNFKEHMGLRDEFLRELGFLIKSARRRVVLFLDDIDRCHDAEMMEVMRTINYLTGLDDLFIVMGIDHDKVIEAVRRHYLSYYPRDVEIGSEIYQKIEKQSKNYVNKIFNITVRIPDKGSEFIKSYRPLKGNRTQQVYRDIYSWGAKIHRLRKGIDHVLLSSILLFVPAFELWEHRSELVELSRELSKVMLYEKTQLGRKKDPASERRMFFEKKEYVRIKAVSQAVTEESRRESFSPEEERRREGNVLWQRYFLSMFLYLAFLLFLTGIAWNRFRVILRYARLHNARQNALIDDKLAPWHDKINPRELKMIRNKINFFLSIGERDFTYQGYFFSQGSKVWAAIAAVLFHIIRVRSMKKGRPVPAMKQVTWLYYQFMAKLYRPEKKNKLNLSNEMRQKWEKFFGAKDAMESKEESVKSARHGGEIGDAERVDDLLLLFKEVVRLRGESYQSVSLQKLGLHDPVWIDLHKDLLYLDDLPGELI